MRLYKNPDFSPALHAARKYDPLATALERNGLITLYLPRPNSPIENYYSERALDAFESIILKSTTQKHHGTTENFFFYCYA